VRAALGALILCLCLFSGCRQEPPLAGGKPVSYWVEALSDMDPARRKTAVHKLGNVGMSDPEAFPALLKALKDDDAGVRCEAIIAVAKFGPDGKDAMPTLTELEEHDASPKVRDYAKQALEKLRKQQP
jgi:HEAT repeat protein